MLKVYYGRRPAADGIAQAIERLPRWRRERLAALKNENARRSALGAGLLWRQVMEENGLDPEQPVGYLPAGKPVFTDGNVFFSLSHSGELCLCALSDGPVGADVQIVRPAKASIARYFCPDEQQYLARTEPEKQNDALLWLWTRKEAWIKAASRERTLALDEYSVLACPLPWKLSSFRLPEGSFAAVCAAETADGAEERKI